MPAGLMMISVLAGSVSCENPDYDLQNKEINTEIKVLENISMPVGDLNKITIKDILFNDTQELSRIKEDASGDLSLELVTGTVETSIDLPSFSVEGIRMEDATINFLIPSQFAGMDAGILGDRIIRYSDLADGGLSFKMDIDIDNVIPGELDDIKEVELDGVMSCNFTVSAGKVYVSKGFRIVFPSYLNIAKNGSSTDYSVPDNHTIVFEKDTEISASKPLSLILSFNKLTIPEGAFIKDGNSLKRLVVNDEISVDGDLYIRTSDYSSIPSKLQVVMHIGFDRLQVISAMASLDMDIELPSEEIAVEGLPDMFSGTDICADFYNPYMYLSLDNRSPFSFNAAAAISAVYAASTERVEIGTSDSPVSAAAMSESEYFISRRKMDVHASAANIVIPEIADLVKKIPAAIKIHDAKVTPVTELITLDAGATYPVNAEYAVVAPLSFDKEFNLTFSQDVNDLGIYFESALSKVVIKADIYNSIPLNFALSGECIDVEGNVIKDVKLVLDKAIAAGTQSSPSHTPVQLIVTNSADNFRIDGIRFNLVTTSTSPEYFGVCLNSGQGFEIRNISVNLPDGIIIKDGESE